MVTSVSVIMDTGNGSQAIFSDAVGKPVSKPPTSNQLASPINLLNPDRYEFYTFDDNGGLVKRLMTLNEIQSIIASGDGESLNYNSKPPSEEMPEKKVADVVNNVQNVLKEEIESHKNSNSQVPLDTPDVSASWSMILPAIFGNSGENIQPPKSPNVPTPDTITIDSTTLNPTFNDISTFKHDYFTKIVSSQKPSSLLTTEKLSAFTKTNPTTLRLPESTVTAIETREDVSSTVGLSSSDRTEAPLILLQIVSDTNKSNTNETVLKEGPSNNKTEIITKEETNSNVLKTDQTLSDVADLATESMFKTVYPLNSIPSAFNEINSKRPSVIKRKPPSTATKIPVPTIVKEQNGQQVNTASSIADSFYSTQILTSSAPSSLSTLKLISSSDTTPLFTPTKPQYSSSPSIPQSPVTHTISSSTSSNIPQTTETTYYSNISPVSYSTALSSSTTNAVKTENTIANENTVQTSKLPELLSTWYTQTQTVSNNDLDTATNSYTLLTTSELRTTTTESPLPGKTTVDTAEPQQTTTEQDEFLASSTTLRDISNDATETVFIKVSDPAQNSEADNEEKINVTKLLNQLLQTTNIYEINTELSRTTPSITTTIPEETHFTQTTPELTTEESTTSSLKDSIDQLIQQTVNNVEQPIENLREAEKISEVIGNSSSKPMVEFNSEAATAASVLVAKPDETSAQDNSFNDAISTLMSQVINQVPSHTTIENVPITTEKENAISRNSIRTTLIDENLSTTEDYRFDQVELITMSTVPNKYSPASIADIYSKHSGSQISSEQSSTTELNTDETAYQSTLFNQPTTTVVQEEQNTSTTPQYQGSTQLLETSESVKTNYKNEIENSTPTPAFTKLTTLSVTTETGRTEIPQANTHATESATTTRQLQEATSTEVGDQYSTTIRGSTEELGNTELISTSLNRITTAQDVADINLLTSTNPSLELDSATNTDTTDENITQKDLQENNYDSQTTWSLISTAGAPQQITTITPNTEYPEVTSVELVPKPVGGFGLEDTTASLDTDIYKFSELCNELAFSFWNSVTSGISFARSVVVSPFAATSMLAMVFLGARGSTSGEMNEILKLDDMVTFNPHSIFKGVAETIEVSKKSGVAASVMVKELYSDKSKGRVLPFYKERVKQFYDAHVEEASFREIGDVIRRRTNLLVKRQTWGKIPEYLRDSTLTVRPPLAAVSANVFQVNFFLLNTERLDFMFVSRRIVRNHQQTAEMVNSTL